MLQGDRQIPVSSDPRSGLDLAIQTKRNWIYWSKHRTKIRFIRLIRWPNPIAPPWIQALGECKNPFHPFNPLTESNRAAVDASTRRIKNPFHPFHPFNPLTESNRAAVDASTRRIKNPFHPFHPLTRLHFYGFVV